MTRDEWSKIWHFPKTFQLSEGKRYKIYVGAKEHDIEFIEFVGAWIRGDVVGQPGQTSIWIRLDQVTAFQALDVYEARLPQ